jgi:hypothetical protein
MSRHPQMQELGPSVSGCTVSLRLVYPAAGVDRAYRREFQAGHSVLANVTDFLPYFYIAVPRGFIQDDLESFRSDLNVSRMIFFVALR